MTPDPGPLLELLAEARDTGRPALVLTARRVVEVLGAEPDPAWWSEHRNAWAAAGFALSRDDRGQLTCTPLPPAGDRPAEERPDPTDVRVVVGWGPALDARGPGVWRRDGPTFGTYGDPAQLRPGDLVVTAVSVDGAELDLADVAVRTLALLAARLADGPSSGGGSGI